MKKFSIWALLLIFAVSAARAQDSATQQQIDSLNGKIQDLQELSKRQEERIAALEKQVADLGEKVNAPVVQKDFVEREDLKKLAQQVQEIDRKRQDDRELILKQIEALAKVAATPVPAPVVHHSTKVSSDDSATSDSSGSSSAASSSSQKENGYEYPVKQGDTLGLIVKAYREKGVKVTRKMIIDANPKMNPDVLIPGKKIFIPDPSATK